MMSHILGTINKHIGLFQSQATNSTQQSNPNLAFMEEFLLKSGVVLSFSDEPNALTQEQALVVRDLEKALKEDAETKIGKLIAGVKFLCKKERYFKKALAPTVLRKENVAGNIQQDSLFRLLLRINCIQNELIDFLLEEITTLVSEDTPNEDTSWLRQLLNPLRYLPHIKDGKNLTTKLMDIIEISHFAAQLEILDSIPKILPDNEYCETAKELIALLDQNENLTAAIVDCLYCLNLDNEMRTQVEDKILAKILAGASPKIFPILVEFFFKKAQNLTPVLFKVRNALDNIMSNHENDKHDDDSSKLLIFSKLRNYISTPKTATDAWLNTITTIKVNTDHKPVDFLILFMIHTCAKHKRRTIEQIFRKRVKDGLFKCGQIEKLFDKYITQQLLKDFFGSIIEVASSLIRSSSDPANIEFATTIFKVMFHHPYTEVIYRQEIVDNLILLIDSNDNQHVGPILDIFTQILEEDYTKLQKHTLILMGLLENVDSLKLKNIKQIFEILCALTCGPKSDETMSGLKDEIHIIIRKQLSSAQKNLIYRGIISAVVMAKHIATITLDQTELNVADETMLSVDKLPNGPAREAALILELTNTCTLGIPDFMGLFYDELASMLVTATNLDKHFVAWLYETITNDFQLNFVVETIPEAINDLEFTVQYSLNEQDEINSPISINIAELTVKPEVCSNKTSISILAPHFRLLRLLHYKQQNGDLSTIDALLGCGVVMPNTEDIDSLDYDQVIQTADCLFHCINWFREIISGFILQKSKKLRHKVMERLQNLITLESLLKKCLDSVPQHKLPQSYFDSLSQSNKQCISPKKELRKKPAKKKIKSAETVNDETILPSTSAQVSTAKPTATKSVKKISHSNTQHISYRELDIDLIILLKYPTSDVDATQQSQSAVLGVPQLNFILQDFVEKLKVLTKAKSPELSHLNTISPLNIITDCKHILPNINKHLGFIISELNKLLEQIDGRHDLPEAFTEETNELKSCFGLILEIMYLIFSWTGFQHSKHLDLFKELLKSIRPKTSQSLHSANRLTVDLVARLAGFVDVCLNLRHGVHLIKTMQALCDIMPHAESKKLIINTSNKLLEKRWYNNIGHLDSGKNFLLSIDYLLKVYLDGATVKTLCGLVGTIQNQVEMLKTKEDCLHMLASIDKTNFYILYRSLCNALHSRVKLEVQSLTNSEHLTLWRTTVLTMQGLMTTVKKQETKANLVTFLKKSIAILKIFLSHGVPILEIMLKSKPDKVVEILKTMQTNTRFLHHLCCFSKLTKDSSLMSYVPQFRLTLETLVYRVKAALVANNCEDAFWMGNLKNRDLHGEDINSQSTMTSESNVTDPNNEEELPEDDSDSDIDNNEATNVKDDDKNKSDSDVYE